jgi:hypothetical protein
MWIARVCSAIFMVASKLAYPTGLDRIFCWFNSLGFILEALST